MGVNLDLFDIGTKAHGDYYVKIYLKNRSDYFQWVLMVVYGAAQQEYQGIFLSELVQACTIESLAMMTVERILI